jgi:hypothetical protein
MTMTKTMLITANELKAGDVVTQFPYGGPEALPVTVRWKHRARAKNALIIEGTDAKGQNVMVPVGHYGNSVRIQERA